MSLGISILVPVYNVARWLPAFSRCMARQRLENAELLFLDDCSKDDSVQVLEQEIWKNGLSSVARILHHNENRGVSEARQSLLEAAKGEYVIFADPDDEIEPGMYEGLLATARSTNADFIWEDFYEGSAERRSQRFSGNSECLLHDILGDTMHVATWNKLIRRQFITECGARFLPGRICLCEDFDFICQVLAANPKVAYSDGCHYHYRTVSDSATHGLSEASFKSLKAVERHLTSILPVDVYGDDLEYWRKGNCLAAFLSDNVSNSFFYEYIGNVRNLSGLPTNTILKGLYWLGARGMRSLARIPYRVMR